MNEDKENTVDEAFKKQFAREVREEYQGLGSKLRQTVRTIETDQAGVVFQKVGKGMASTKSTHGMVPVMNLAHKNASAYLDDYFAGDWIEGLEKLKTNISERRVIARSAASSLGRKTDELIINALADCDCFDVIEGDSLTKEMVLQAFEIFGEYDVPDDGQRFAVVGWKQWADLLKNQEFANAPYVEPSSLPFATLMQAKYWLGTIWLPHSGLPIDGSDMRSCFYYHMHAVGHAAGKCEVDITWHGDRHAHFVNAKLPQAAVLIDSASIIQFKCNESAED